MIDARLIRSLVSYLDAEKKGRLRTHALVLAAEAASAILMSALPRPQSAPYGAQAEALASITSGLLLAARRLGLDVPPGLEAPERISLYLVEPQPRARE